MDSSIRVWDIPSARYVVKFWTNLHLIQYFIAKDIPLYFTDYTISTACILQSRYADDLYTTSVCFRLVDCFLLDSPATSLAFSPTGDFLATSHLDDIGIFLWYVHNLSFST